MAEPGPSWYSPSEELPEYHQPCMALGLRFSIVFGVGYECGV